MRKLLTHKMGTRSQDYRLACGQKHGDNPVFVLGHGCSAYWSDVTCPDCLATRPDLRDVWSVEGHRRASADPAGPYTHVRLIIFEVDPEDGYRTVKDIREYSVGGFTPTQMARNMTLRWPSQHGHRGDVFDEDDVRIQEPEGFVMPPRLRVLQSKVRAVVEYVIAQGAQREG